MNNGGVEAVVWTDTIQTFVLLGGALLCLGLMLSGTEGGIGSFDGLTGWIFSQVTSFQRT